MKFTNFNFYTILIFIILVFILIFILNKKLKNIELLNNNFVFFKERNKYFLYKVIILFLAFIIALLSIFGIKYQTKETYETNSLDIIFTLDVSKSMNVADFYEGNNYYTRLEISKNIIKNYISKNKQNRYGLVIFAGESVSTIPLTDDIELFSTLLEGVDYRNLVKQGSDFIGAIKLSLDRFTKEEKTKVLIFISDGGDLEDEINYDSIKAISKKGENINYFVIGVGTQKGGKIISGQDLFGRYIYQTFDGEEVISKLNISNLENISKSLNSYFYQINSMSGVSNFLEGDFLSKLDKLTKNVSISSEIDIYKDLSRNLIILSFCLFMLFFGIYIYK